MIRIISSDKEIRALVVAAADKAGVVVTICRWRDEEVVGIKPLYAEGELINQIDAGGEEGRG